MPAQRDYDYVIVGAGSAGCVLAARLTEQPGCRVLLLEAGGSDRHLYIHMPASAALAARHPDLVWDYRSEPEPQLGGRRVNEQRGRVLGGSSSVNGMVANRGNPRDYDAWAAQGLPGWSFADCLPYFRKMETFDRGADAWRGGDGPQVIETCPADNPLDRAFLECGPQAGYDLTPDQNGRRHEGFHVAQAFTRKGKRWSTADGYLRPALARPDLAVETHALAHRVLFDGRRAVGVEYVRFGERHRVTAEREVILAGGAINSPQLLLLSGVGDTDHLRHHGIRTVAHVPAVGRHLEDHMTVPIQYRTARPVSVARRLDSQVKRWRLGLEWLLFRRGLGTTTFCDTGCFFRSSEDQPYANLQHEFYPLCAEVGSDEHNFAEGFMFSMGIMRPASRGRVSLKSADPAAHPAILFNYLAEPGDAREMIDGVHRTREMVAQGAWNGLRGEEMTPGPGVRTDDEILAWIRTVGSTEYHPSSTCRMGTGDDSATDAEGRVHAVEGLRVVDASIMPSNVTANLNAPVIMMAEKLADAIRGVAPLPRSDARVD